MGYRMTVSTGCQMRVKSVPDVTFCLVFQRETLSVPVMRRVLGDTLRRLGMDSESVYDILLAATEACTNVLTHGGRQVREYAVVTSLGAVGCQVQVTDEGAGAMLAEAGRRRVAPGEPPAAGGPDERGPDERGRETAIAQLPESGRGLAVMRACVDNVTLDSSPGRGTVVTMRKHVRWSRNAPLRQFRAAS
jgi:serine/threonine-protein kinase RsbW